MTYKPYRHLKNSVSIFLIACLVNGCSLGDLVDVDPAENGNRIEHEFLKTRSGAMGLLYNSISLFQSGFSSASLDVAMFTDELISMPYTGNVDKVDTRVEIDGKKGLRGLQFAPFATFQSSRVSAVYARHFLRANGDTSLRFAISAAYAIEGYANLMLAENLCSGIPLANAAYGEEIQIEGGIPTDSVYKIAIAKFDSALAINHDSLRYKTLANIGKARALVGLGKFAEAAQQVAVVGNAESYNLQYSILTVVDASGRASYPAAFWTHALNVTIPPNDQYEIMNQEGLNGLIWFSDPNNVDPRLPVPVTTTQNGKVFPSIVRQQKFVNGAPQIKLATGIEARLIEAEHKLQLSDPSWIDPINEARATVNLPSLESPMEQKEKVDLLFRERALWFYGHATRLADMRRLVRQYNREVNDVYPIGGYNRSQNVFAYGDATTFIPSFTEWEYNHKYTGCIDKRP